MRSFRSLLLVGLLLYANLPGPARAFEAGVFDSVVRVLPLWPGHRLGGTPGTPPGSAPEGTAVAVLAGGYLATALHVVDQATEITVRLGDGRQMPAELLAADPATDVALLRIAADLPVLPMTPEPPLGTPVCAVGNQFGLGLSVTCGVVSATRRSGVGFNPVEDFIQTDASVNPGSSGGALVDGEGRLVGMLSAIFTKGSDADIGVNFAISAALLIRVVEDLAAHGRVLRALSGFRVADLEGDGLSARVGARVIAVQPGGAAEAAGLSPGDLVTAVAGRAVGKASDVVAAVALHRPGDRLTLEVLRAGAVLVFELALPD
ncbi:MAG: trypsin-like peptidase domain-containing protein [Kiloniellales bacterium]